MSDDLTPAQRKLLDDLMERHDELLELVEQQRRYAWLRTVIRNAAAWIAVVLGGGIALWTVFQSSIKAALK